MNRHDPLRWLLIATDRQHLSQHNDEEVDHAHEKSVVELAVCRRNRAHAGVEPARTDINVGIQFGHSAPPVTAVPAAHNRYGGHEGRYAAPRRGFVWVLRTGKAGAATVISWKATMPGAQVLPERPVRRALRPPLLLDPAPATEGVGEVGLHRNVQSFFQRKVSSSLIFSISAAARFVASNVRWRVSLINCTSLNVEASSLRRDLRLGGGQRAQYRVEGLGGHPVFPVILIDPFLRSHRFLHPRAGPVVCLHVKSQCCQAFRQRQSMAIARSLPAQDLSHGHTRICCIEQLEIGRAVQVLQLLQPPIDGCGVLLELSSGADAARRWQAHLESQALRMRGLTSCRMTVTAARNSRFLFEPHAQ